MVLPKIPKVVIMCYIIHKNYISLDNIPNAMILYDFIALILTVLNAREISIVKYWMHTSII